MTEFTPHLCWIDSQHESMCRLVGEWSRLNSGSHNLLGLQACAAAIEREFSVFGVPAEHLPLKAPPRLDEAGRLVPQKLGEALRLRKRRQAPLQVFLCIHYDTVYAPDHPFQEPMAIDGNRLQGPGVADAKGGLVVLLKAMEALERSPWAPNIGWEVLLNPDEEIGSPGSFPLLMQAAGENDLGLLFEPALPDGALVGARKGSGNFTLRVTGRSAHVGRNPEAGRNAIHALADFIVSLHAMSDPAQGIVASVGYVSGGGPANVVPDRAGCHFNLRVTTSDQQRQVEDRLRQIVHDINTRDGIVASLHGAFHAPPKVLDEPTRRLLEAIRSTGHELGLDLTWRATGGVSDGNKLAAAGLPNVDSLGVRGGNLHSSEEFVLLDSLTERAKLTALLLMRLAKGELPWPGRAAG